MKEIKINFLASDDTTPLVKYYRQSTPT